MLQFITHQSAQYSYIDGAIKALEGGCKWIQLRMKEADKHDICQAIDILKPLCREQGATFILDDYVELAIEYNVDGVHLGKNDMSPSEARRLMGSNYIIGGTANTFEDIQNLVHQGVDYIGLGPYRYTQTKQNLSPILGLDGYKNILSQCRNANITTPIIAIGGIEANDIEPIIKCGVSGIALSGAILQSDYPAQYTRNIISTLNNIKR